MFTPPPSPLPRPLDPFDAHASPSMIPSPPSSSTSASSLSPNTEPCPNPHSPSSSATPQRTFSLSPPPKRSPHISYPPPAHVLARKRSIARRTGLSVLLVPLVLAFITLSTRYVAHPAAFDVLSGVSRDPPPAWSDWHDAGAHPLAPRGVAPVTSLSEPATLASTIVFPTSSQPSASSSSSATATATTTTQATVPMIPSSPPVLPTPFPQPFDTTMIQNYSATCTTFFKNMTNTLPFRQCRAFSFLSQVSSQFIEAQTNITQLNIDIWGTCNTPVSEDQCSANMSWFADGIQSACAQDIGEQNASILQSVQSLKTYDLLRQAACLADAGTGAYCYVEAAAAPNPADLYLYSLPFGTAFPTQATPSCSTCAKSIMALFYAEASTFDGLKKTYNAAASAANARCGQNYVSVAQGLPDTSGGGRARGRVPCSAFAVVVALMAALST